MPSKNFLTLRICILSFSDIKLSLLPELSRSKIVMFSLTKRQLFYLNRYFDPKYSALSLWNTDIWGKLHWTLAHRSSSTVVAMILTCVERGMGLGGLITIDTFFSENIKCQWIQKLLRAFNCLAYSNYNFLSYVQKNCSKHFSKWPTVLDNH